MLVYSGHSGSVNSVRFRDHDSLMLTCSGDGAAHLIALPPHFFEAVAATANLSVLGAFGDLENGHSEGVFEYYPISFQWNEFLYLLILLPIYRDSHLC